jgi:prepilin-type N-terminal cleavage/methylation domain-containing protein
MKNLLSKLKSRGNSKTAFSLIELSIVIVIVSILVTGALTASLGNVRNAKTKITNDRIQTIYKAMGNYLLANGRIPCPSSVARIKSSDSSYGAEEGTAGTCATSGHTFSSNTATSLIYGSVPIRALGLSDEFMEDGFETKFGYIVNKNFTASGTSSSTFGGATATSIIIVNEKPASSITHADTADAIFVIVSYGTNKSGGYNASAATQNTRSTDTDEMENDITGVSGSTATFDNTYIAASVSSDTFDDIVFYKTRNQMAVDHKALTKINCAAATVSGYVMPIGYYNQNAVSTTACGTSNGPTYPQIRCGAFGTWASWIAIPCS